MMDSNRIADALTATGDLLRAAGERLGIVVTGGAAMNLLGMVRRATGDVDVIAQAYRDREGRVQLEPAEPFAQALEEAIQTVARDLGLDPQWMNADVGKQWSQGLPPWLLEDLTWKNFGVGLDVGLVGRRTLIALKLFATVDCGPNSVHAQDLEALAASPGELRDAAAWVRTQDAAPEWPKLVEETLAHVDRAG